MWFVSIAESRHKNYSNCVLIVTNDHWKSTNDLNIICQNTHRERRRRIKIWIREESCILEEEEEEENKYFVIMMISSDARSVAMSPRQRFFQCSMNMMQVYDSKSDSMLMYVFCVLCVWRVQNIVIILFAGRFVDIRYLSFAINDVTQSKRFSIVSFDVMPNWLYIWFGDVRHSTHIHIITTHHTI